MFFGSDNGLGASEPIMAAIVAANSGAALGYGNDAATKKLEATMSALFEREVAVYLVATGTAANGLALASLVDPWAVVLTHEQSHVGEDECCGPEFFTGGAKIVGVPGVGCKITPDGLAAVLGRLPRRIPHGAPIQALSITNATELGLVYRPDEVRALSAIAKSEGMALHMDGARFANAVASLGCSPAEITWKAGVDALSFGATKGGAIGCEAVIFFDPAKGAEMVRRRMRAGHLMSKHRFLAAQMQAFLDGDHWLHLAGHANAMAKRLGDGLARQPGARVPLPVEANEVFPVLSAKVEAALKAEGAVFYPWSPHSLPEEGQPRAGETVVRLVTSFATKLEDVERFLAIARNAA